MALSEARKKANAKYNAKNYDKLGFTVKKGNKDYLKEVATEQGKSLNNFVITSINDTLEKLGKKPIS